MANRPIRLGARAGAARLVAGVAALVAFLPLGLPALGSAARAAAVPPFRHVFVIVLENESFSATWGPSSPAKYLNSLVPKGAFATNYYGVSHLSADNYMAMTSGQTPSPVFQSDCQNWEACEASEKASPDGGVSVADQIEAAGRSWRAYMDSMPAPCTHPAATDLQDPYSVGYATRHDPFVYYPPIVEQPRRCDSHVVAYSSFAKDLQKESTTPTYSFISPDTCHDGHDATCPGGKPGGLVAADAWLSANVPAILGSAAFKDRGVLFIVTDEAANTDISGCCLPGGGPVPGMSPNVVGGGRVGLLALSPLARTGTSTATPYDHYSLLRTVEDGLGLRCPPAALCQDGHLNRADLAQSMTDLFRGA